METFADVNIEMNEPSSTSAQQAEKPSSDESATSTHVASKDSDFRLTPSEQSGTTTAVIVERHLIPQSDFQNIIRDFDLSDAKAEVLASRLKQWRLVTDDSTFSTCIFCM